MAEGVEVEPPVGGRDARVEHGSPRIAGDVAGHHQLGPGRERHPLTDQAACEAGQAFARAQQAVAGLVDPGPDKQTSVPLAEAVEGQGDGCVRSAGPVVVPGPVEGRSAQTPDVVTAGTGPIQPVQEGVQPAPAAGDRRPAQGTGEVVAGAEGQDRQGDLARPGSGQLGQNRCGGAVATAGDHRRAVGQPAAQGGIGVGRHHVDHRPVRMAAPKFTQEPLAGSAAAQWIDAEEDVAHGEPSSVGRSRLQHGEPGPGDLRPAGLSCSGSGTK